MDTYEDNLRGAFEAHNGGRSAEAEAACRRLLVAGTSDPRLHFLLGMVLHRLEREAEAVEPLRRAAQLNPSDAAIFNGLGCVFHRLRDDAQAVENFQRAIALKPDAADLYYSLGNAYYELGAVELAMLAFRDSVQRNPQDAPSWNNLGKTLNDLGRLEESLAAYDAALKLVPDYGLAHYGRALALLASGNLGDGFREYEWRPWRGRREFAGPRWAGEPLVGRTIFLHAEQGYGDAIQAIRYLPQLRERGARVILECRPELKRLFTFAGCAEVVIGYGEPVPSFDCFTSLMSVAGALGIELETIPQRVPYLSAPKRGGLPGGRPNIGLAWAGNPTHHDDALRSIRLAELDPILALPGMNFHSLQMPVPARDQERFVIQANLANLAGGFQDFLDTAAAIAELDLVIAVDTAVAHLAGALGKPVWVMLQHAPDWRWFRSFGGTTPWYPTARLFRQPARGDWGPVVARVAQALTEFKPVPLTGGGGSKF